MFSDALDREADWLNQVDTLPALNKISNGPFQTVQARVPRIPAARKTQLYVQRAPSNSFHVTRYASQRSMLTTQLLLRLYWPLTNGTGSAEADQLAFEQAIDLVLARIEGPLGDKTHGGRFLSVAEDKAGISVHYADPAQGMTDGIFTASISYTADDPEITN